MEEILALAKENGVELTEAEAEKYFASLNPEYGNFADEELGNVAGGTFFDEQMSGHGTSC